MGGGMPYRKVVMQGARTTVSKTGGKQWRRGALRIHTGSSRLPALWPLAATPQAEADADAAQPSPLRPVPGACTPLRSLVVLDWAGERQVRKAAEVGVGAAREGGWAAAGSSSSIGTGTGNTGGRVREEGGGRTCGCGCMGGVAKQAPVAGAPWPLAVKKALPAPAALRTHAPVPRNQTPHPPVQQVVQAVRTRLAQLLHLGRVLHQGGEGTVGGVVGGWVGGVMRRVGARPVEGTRVVGRRG